MASVPVPFSRPEPQALSTTWPGIVVAAPVSSVSWQAYAYLCNWLRGKGACLVPRCFPERSISAASTEVFRFLVKTRSSAIERVWLVLLRTGTAVGVTAVVRAPASTGTAVTIPVSASPDRRTLLLYTEPLGSKSATEAQIDVDIQAVGATVIVDGIACYEQDRPCLNQDSTDLGVDPTTCGSGQPIYDGDFVSAGGIYDTLAGVDSRRVGIFHWTAGDSTAVARTTASYDSILQLPVPVLARKKGTSAVTGSVKWAAFAKVDAGAGGQVRLTTTESGVSDAVTVTGTSYAWTTARSISIDCDDMQSEDGRQTAASPAWDDLDVAIQGDGTNAIRVKSVSVWSDD